MLNHKTAVRFVLLFFTVFAALYMLNYSLTGLIQPGGFYSQWIAEHFDYITVFRGFLLRTTGSIIELLGYKIYLKENILYVNGGNNIRMVYSCIGINILCVWWALIIAFPIEKKTRFFYFIIGTICLITINITRLTLLSISTYNYTLGKLAIDHHTIYNWIVYGLILIAIKRVLLKSY